MKEDKKKLLAKVAYMYYEQELTQAQIAKELAIYRTTVSRMLSQAKAAGIVEIKINHFDPSLFELEEQMKQAFGLTAVELVPTENDSSEEIKEERLAAAAGAWLRRQLSDDMVVGLSWGASVGKAVSKIEPKQLANVSVVPVVGGPSHINSRYHVNTLVYELARKLNGNSLFVNATVIQETKALAEGIFNSKYFHELKEYWKRLDLVIVGIGGPLSYHKSQWRDLLSAADYQELKLREAVGDCCCRFYDSYGKELNGGVNQRTIGLSLTELADVPQSVGIARGISKARSIVPLLKKGYLKTVITDQETAQEILRLNQRK
ncbi:sugar-binding transcriptional regulator [Enterococcus dongliensis]|uniref:Sugar-binding transcriptional regulator n=1 Tax=Enterococcus dongliensis TaxID=2559925 RepID=A0AAP5NN52_9ENTE|nr:sugar-binding transcriptional regulator [Enterococcus dongliensis]MDT2595443.1 sugar-binding transcriptional regulator [Enterococcus dongliensis]MDT2603343.1 sugar-binding transcriptional regulator [Enterococcus dongliensis]MDT2633704.1 sugar-binding transcriptional regulator [Enterococcus dongliensis]MDT2635922.1 sugar-binding transcriptional regulator [Enterococcus dongliensis]MDT2641680.1 sugar-binding transcriptional regulator [Enterococcus dongliensis]